MPFNKSTSLAISFIHIGFWIALYLVPFIDPRGIHPINKLNLNFLLDPHIIINYFFFVALFYSNSQFFVPKFLLTKKYVLYSSIVVCSLLLISTISYLIFPYLKFPRLESAKPPHLPSIQTLRFNQIISLLFPLFFILLVSTLYKLLISKYRSEKKQKEKENEQLKTELLFLRSQISPHFIFNALNSSIILVRKQSEKAEESLIKLASLMRYMLYESDVEKITIGDEVEYIENYIDLQSIRFEKSVDILKKISVNESFQDDFIESMLLIPFIENAFKHGTFVVKGASIEITLYSEGNNLILKTKNKFSHKENIHGETTKNHGIGLSNVKRRLELLYPDKHELKLDTDGEYFNVYLSLQVKE
jgi:two-component system LytT family sensor kinase